MPQQKTTRKSSPSTQRPTQAEESAQQNVAAIDLGSNSFHMIIARQVDGHLHIVDRVREQVQMASGLRSDGKLSAEAQRRALHCARRFRERLTFVQRARVRAVGTNTLRQAKNGQAFRRQLEKELGLPVDIVSGREEARLIYLGVAHDLADDAGRRLVVDIGGGSTECIVGERFEATDMDSLQMGCITFSRKFFTHGTLNQDSFKKANIAALRELAAIQRHYRSIGWDSAVGASGTINSVAQILRANKWSSRGITLEGLKRFEKAMVAAKSTNAIIRIPGVQKDRVDILPGGYSILRALFEAFEIDRMESCSGAMREGVIYDLLGRIRHEDVRDRTIQRFVERYHVDREHALRIETTALDLLAETANTWRLQDESARQFLSWAVRLHEIGLAVSYSGYHKHSAYLIAHSDMPGFSRGEQELVATIVRAHRRKLSADYFDSLAIETQQRAIYLTTIMRLATRLHRTRDPSGAPSSMHLRTTRTRVLLRLPRGWLARHPLTAVDLEDERQQLRNVGIKLDFE